MDRELIYNYFGGFEGLIKVYLNSRDYWTVSPEEKDVLIAQSKADFGKKTVNELIDQQFDSLMSNEEMRKIINWGPSENRIPLQDLDMEREALGDELFRALIDDHFEGKGKNPRAEIGIAISSIYYLTLQARMNVATMCGIDINTEKGASEIKNALKQIIEWVYE
ncbi:TetR/AcrR family transcriptional regulator [Mucilaginibacter sp. 21P]|uniref:TetR/AcrR family transcriptional regulator n=1 Tax=Mucilaginibacter sp. 21P TaxID=2778902 RepID=UPI001C5A2C58|nr:TetR/AcrR family transcriptional regulator [Mucilaginibacter sp. 21P]QXV63651.1 TetR/AcrR family transcriptional regulator [Mucilaginibacter sp. 21P]